MASDTRVRYIVDMDTPAHRLRFLRERNDIGSAAELARRLGIPEVTYRAHESGVRGFGEPQAKRYAEALNANGVWLLTGSGEAFSEPAPPSMPADAPKKRSDVEMGSARAAQPGPSELPVYASAEGGPSGMMVTYDPIDWIRRPNSLTNVGNAFAVYVVGESMEPRYEQGDMILVHPSRPVKRDDDVLLLSQQEDGSAAALIKRLVSWNEQSWIVKQYNPPKEITLPRQQWQKAYVVVGRNNRA